MYVGGLAESVAGRMGSLAGDAEGFKGCIRNMNVNGRSYDLAGVHNVVHRVGQCFASVETGSYFPGDAYAIYSASFALFAEFGPSYLLPRRHRHGLPAGRHGRHPARVPHHRTERRPAQRLRAQGLAVAVALHRRRHRKQPIFLEA